MAMERSRTVLHLRLQRLWPYLILCALSLILSHHYLDLKEHGRPSLKFPKRKEMKRLEDFRRGWLRHRRARIDWLAIMIPCYDNMVWGQVKNGWGKLNRSSATTSDVIFKDIRPAGEFSKIFTQSKTSDNRTKLIGGGFKLSKPLT